MPTPPLRRSLSLEFGAALLVTFAFILWMLSLPCFPSTDGPAHMYFVHVLAVLLSRSDSVYAPFFTIRHVLPPYALYYYALLVLSKFVPMLLADRLIICLYFVSFVLGFRYLARALGPSADRMTLLATLLLLNWPLGMGFVNFCLALSLCFWAAGVWIRIVGTRNLPGRIGFLVLVTATMLTHPVPLLLLLAVAAIILAAHLAVSMRSSHRLALPPHAAADLATLVLASLNLGYVKLFAHANPLQQSADVVPASHSHEVLHRIADYYGRQHALGFLLGHGPALLVYHAGLVLILIAPAGMAVRQRLRNRSAHTWTSGDTFLLIGAAALVFLPFLPSQLNGSYYFADRLVICVWLAFLLAASGWSVPQPAAANAGEPSHPQPRTRLIWLAAALVCNACLLFAANRLLRPAAQRVAALDHATVSPPGQVGILFEDPRQPNGRAADELSWNPYTWALAHVFRHSDAIMANPPWMDVTIIPVGPADRLPELSIPALQQSIPSLVQRDLLRSPHDLARTLQTVDFFAVNQIDRSTLPGTESLLQTQSPFTAGWTCARQGWYRLCRRPPASFAP